MGSCGPSSDEFFERPPQVSLLQRALRSCRGRRRGELHSLRHLPRRMPEADGLETVNVVAPARGTKGEGHDCRTAARNTPVGCEAEAGTLPRIGAAAPLRPVHAEAVLGISSRRGRHAQLAGRSSGAAPLRRHRPRYQDPPRSTAYRYAASGPSGPG